MFGLGGAGYKQGLNAATTAGNVGSQYGSESDAINAQLLPFLTRELNNPQGFTQQQQGAMLGSAEAGAGGSTAGLTTEANLASARNRNSGSFSGALDEAARQRDKALAGTSEGIAAKDAELQQTQRQEAASGLAGQRSLDTNAQLKAMGLVPEDIDASTKAYGTGDWADSLGRMMGVGMQAAKLAGGFGIPGFGGFKPQ